MMTVDSQTEAQKFISFDLLPGTSESTRAKTAETFLELLGARVRNPNTRSAYRVAWRSFLAFCSARQLELESVKAYHVGSWLRLWEQLREYFEVRFRAEKYGVPYFLAESEAKQSGPRKEAAGARARSGRGF